MSTELDRVPELPEPATDAGLLDADAAEETRAASPCTSAQRSIVLVGLMGAGKTTVGRRLAALMGLPFRDADAEIERAAGSSIADLFARYGEAEFRDGERRVIRRLLRGAPIVLATGGGAYTDAETRALIRANARSVWLRCPLPVLLRRVSGRVHRPLLNAGNPRDILDSLMRKRSPIYAEADLIVDCGDDGADVTTRLVASAIEAHVPPRRLRVSLTNTEYDVVIGEGLIRRAGALLAPVLPQKRVFVVTDRTVARLHLPALLESLAETGFTAETVIVPPGEGSKRLAEFGRVTDAMLAAGVERRTTVIAFGGGVVGDLAGYAAASVMRGLPFVQIPTTLLAQVDSSVGGKTGINTDYGKNLLGAFHQPHLVLADTTVLATLPPRELSAGYAEIVKAALIGDAPFYDWCEVHGPAITGTIPGGADRALQAEAILQACAFKADVVGDDEREERPDDGRALLNLGHTFAHALEAECNYDGSLLHGEAVAIGLVLAFELSARLGFCDPALAARIARHLEAVGLPSQIGMLNRRLDAGRLLTHMQRDKKMRDGRLAFVLARGIGQAFTDRTVPREAVASLLTEATCQTNFFGN